MESITGMLKTIFVINWWNKTISVRHYQVKDTKIINKISTWILNLPLALFKIYFILVIKLTWYNMVMVNVYT